MTENENVERFRRQEQPKKADEIKRAMNIGFHLKCLRCGAAYYHTEFAMSEMSYRMYSYCPACIDTECAEYRKYKAKMAAAQKRRDEERSADEAQSNAIRRTTGKYKWNR